MSGTAPTSASPEKFWDKLKDAPSPNLPFPSSTTANFTLIEHLTFLPNTLKSWDVIERIVSNGASTPILAYIINNTRDMPYGLITNNSLLRLMQNAVRLRTEERYQNWTVQKHRAPVGWNEKNVGLSVGGFRTPATTYPRKHGKWNDPPPPVAFKDLVSGVKRMPKGKDALDLTRCVEYHIEHPDEEWVYPDQFEALVMHLGGPMEVTYEHLDSVAFGRWAAMKRVGIVRVREREDPAEVGVSAVRKMKAGVTKKRTFAELLMAAGAGGNRDGTENKNADEERVKEEKVGFAAETDSEGEEIRQSYLNWKKHGIEGLYMPIKKRG
ncbi:hypothetical protein K458DRAFT_370856 [Lentithecium fluviatile CBS 122367]|uniref:Uncharacterized protein n=1 Tax=Lentithecium fluviatile CBS 122367 TaxID=1168545 RepID=A0A6G1IW55_9PLEO|nr:hypothetical protein K458DRAFT_370856 [Lentithecium fluviatile CBS 122367]